MSYKVGWIFSSFGAAIFIGGLIRGSLDRGDLIVAMAVAVVCYAVLKPEARVV